MRTWSLFLTIVLLYFRLNPAVAQDFSAVDEQARSISYPANASVTSFANTLAGPCRTEKEKVRAIYVWIAENIRYDVKVIENKELTAEEINAKQQPLKVLKTKRAVCDGYANLFEALCEAAGVAVEKVTGWSKNPKGKIARIGHAWNIVRADGQWGLVDATWGAGIVDPEEGRFQQKFNEAFFFSNPYWLILDHFPNDPLFQLLAQPITYEDFRQDKTVLSNHLNDLPDDESALSRQRDSLQFYIQLDSVNRQINSSWRILRTDPDNAVAWFTLASIYYDRAQLAYAAYQQDKNAQVAAKVRPTTEQLQQLNRHLQAMRAGLQQSETFFDKIPSGHQYHSYARKIKANAREGIAFCENTMRKHEGMMGKKNP